MLSLNLIEFILKMLCQVIWLSLKYKEKIWLAKALVECGLESSTSAARRSISANAVSVNSQKVSDEQMYLEQGEYILQIGKRKFAKLKVKE